ncbi:MULTISPECIES: thermonuclease family protein [unclassified Acinetobacter]|uniref:thermonuclease family protein n=1 Tax=unclassified Acinetobacter TaxID=196816 RepID=UPI0035B92758
MVCSALLVTACKSKPSNTQQPLKTLVTPDSVDIKVVAVIDGDTIDISLDGSKTRVRLANIDAPEKAQKYGTQAKQKLADLLLNKSIYLQKLGKDKYGRTLGTDTVNGLNINKEMVKSGYAWAYMTGDVYYNQLQLQAQREKLGLWADSNPIPPNEWRKHNGEGF